MSNSTTAWRKITLEVQVGHEVEAFRLVDDFLTKYPDNHRAHRPERHGVGYRTSRGSFFAYGNSEHVRVRESQSYE